MTGQQCTGPMPRFAGDWIAAWNKRDIERVLAHCADAVRFTSPAVVSLFGRADGTLRGREELAAYLREGLSGERDASVELVAEARGVGTTTLICRFDGRLVCETLRFDERGRIVEALAHYAEAPARRGPAGLVRAAFDTVLDWIERSAGRRRLASLDQRMLSDIGLSRADAVEESSKPFWRYS